MSRIADQTSVVILTFNEEDNIDRTLAPLAWARDVLIVDSGSTDRTLQMVAKHPNCRVVSRPFDTFAGQCNFALTQVETPWVLSMDADYVLSEALVVEIGKLQENPSVDGYRAAFVYQIYETRLRGALYPPRTVLYRRDKARYQDYGHGHAVAIGGQVVDLKSKIYHDDRKPLARWFGSQIKYARQEADYLLDTPREQLKTTDKIRLTMVLGPILAPAYALILKGCILDGPAGWLYVLQRLLAETLIAIELLDRKLRR